MPTPLIQFGIFCGNSTNKRLNPILNDCRSFWNNLEDVKISHIYREANACANSLAKFGSRVLCNESVASSGSCNFVPSLVDQAAFASNYASVRTNLSIFRSPPNFILDILRLDEASYVFYRHSL